jgi:SAM-dependent methyltransferase
MDLGERIAGWEAEAAAYDEAADHGLTDPLVRDAWWELLERLTPEPPGRAADLGCGTGSLTLLLADLGFRVDAVDFSPSMVAQARAKTAGTTAIVTEGDAADPPLAASAYDLVLARHVLWAMPSPAAALDRWVGLLRPGGRLVLVEGRWSTGAGLTADQTAGLASSAGLVASVERLDDPAYWGRPITDERYAVSAIRRA